MIGRAIAYRRMERRRRVDSLFIGVYHSSGLVHLRYFVIIIMRLPQLGQERRCVHDVPPRMTALGSSP